MYSEVTSNGAERTRRPDRTRSSFELVGMVVRIVLARIVYQPSRSTLTVAALASVICVVLVLEGFRSGLYAQLRDAVYNRHATLFVVQQGVENFIGTRSAIPQFVRAKIEAVPGVGEVSPLTVVPVVFDKGGLKTPILLVVSDGPGGPGKVLRGSGELGAGTIVVDRSLARRYDLEVDDNIDIGGYPLQISGVTSGAAAFFTPFAFIDYDDLIDFFWALDIGADIASVPIVSFLLITPTPDADPARIANVIKQSVPDVDVINAATLAENDVLLGRDLFNPILGVLLSVAYLTALVVVAIIMFSGVQAHLRDYVVLRAVGLGDGAVVLTLLIESMFVLVMALPCALGLSWVLAGILEVVAPLYRVLPLEPDIVIRTTIGVAVCGIVGALTPVRFIIRIDPSEAFRR